MENVEGTHLTQETTVVERDLGVLISDDLKVRVQVEEAAARVNSALGRLKRAFRSLSLVLWRTLYVAFVRPLLEFAIQVWSHHLKSDIDLLEQVQHRATKTISSIKHLPYTERLQRLGLTSLQEHRVRGDLIEQCKISHNIEVVEFFVPQQQPTSQAAYSLRGHSRRLKRQIVRGCEERHKIFTNSTNRFFMEFAVSTRSRRSVGERLQEPHF